MKRYIYTCAIGILYACCIDAMDDVYKLDLGQRIQEELDDSRGLLDILDDGNQEGLQSRQYFSRQMLAENDIEEQEKKKRTLKDVAQRVIDNIRIIKTQRHGEQPSIIQEFVSHPYAKSLAVNADGSELFIGGHSNYENSSDILGQLSRWQYKIGESQEYAYIDQEKAHPHGIYCLAYNSAAQHIIAGGMMGGMIMWEKRGDNYVERQRIDSPLIEQDIPIDYHTLKPYPLCSLSCSSDGTMLISGGSDQTYKTACYWRQEDGSYKKMQPPISFNDHVYATDVNPQNKTECIFGLANGEIHVARKEDDMFVLSGDPIVIDYQDTQLKHHINAVKYHPNGQLVAVASDDGVIRVMKKRDATFEIMQTLQGHSKSVESLSFNEDGTQLVSGGADGTVRIWRLSDHDGYTHQTTIPMPTQYADQKESAIVDVRYTQHGILALETISGLVRLLKNN